MLQFSTKHTISVAIILLVVTLIVVQIDTVSAASFTVYFYVDGYNEEIFEDGWEKGGVLPYLNATDYNFGYVNASESYPGASFGGGFALSDRIGNFTFEDMTDDIAGRTITEVYIEIYARSLGTKSPTIGIQYYDGSTWRNNGFVTHGFYEDDFNWWVEFSAPPMNRSNYINTWVKVNSTEIRLCAMDSIGGSTDVVIVDCVRLKIIYDYTAPAWHDVEYWYGILDVPDWNLAEIWMGTLGTLAWQAVEIWYGIISAGIGAFFNMCFYLLLFSIGGLGFTPFIAVHGIKQKSGSELITAIVIFAICFALLLTFGGECT